MFSSIFSSPFSKALFAFDRIQASGVSNFLGPHNLGKEPFRQSDFFRPADQRNRRKMNDYSLYINALRYLIEVMIDLVKTPGLSCRGP